MSNYPRDPDYTYSTEFGEWCRKSAGPGHNWQLISGFESLFKCEDCGMTKWKKRST